MIAFTQLSASSQCNYADPSSSNPHFSSVVEVRNAIGLAEMGQTGEIHVAADVYEFY